MVDYQTNRRYITAYNWGKKCGPISDSAALEFVLGYAKERYALSLDAMKAIDEKADSLLRLTGGAGALFAAAATFTNAAEMFVLLWPLIPMALAAGMALIARLPCNVPQPPRVCDLVDDFADSEVDDGAIRAKLPGSYHCAIEGLAIVTDRKAMWVTLASAMICLSMLTLIAALVVRVT